MAPTDSPVLAPGAKIVAISGGSGSGKTTLVGRLKESCPKEGILVLQLDHYYNDLSHLPKEERDQRNFDHPEAFDTALLLSHLEDLSVGKAIDRPTYDFSSHTRTLLKVRVESRPVIILDGILALHWPEIRRHLTLAVYVDVDDDVRFIRRLKRDITERGRSVESVIKQYLGTVKVMHDAYVAPQRIHADMIIRWMTYNDRAVELLAEMANSWVQLSQL